MKLGDRVEDTITGFRGIIVAVTNWIHGCTRHTVQPETLNKDGMVKDSQTFDENQLKVIKAGAAHVTNVQPFEARPLQRPGGPRPDPVQHPKAK